MAAVSEDGQALQYASYELQYDMEIIFASFEAEPEALKWLHEYGYIEINETIILELRKKFGEKTAKKYLSVDQSDLRYKYDRKRNNLMELRKMMKR